MKILIPFILLFMFLVLPAEAEKVIKNLSGSETVSVGPITVPDNWEIHWETKGHYLQILLSSDGSVPLDMLLQQMGPGKGVTKYEKGGSYIFDINVSGEWKVKIVDPN